MPSPYLITAQRFLAAGDHLQAESLAREALADRPDDAEALAFLGALLEQRGLAGEAGDVYERLTRLVPDRLPAWLGLASNRLAENRLIEAAGAWTEAWRLEIGNKRLYNAAWQAHNQIEDEPTDPTPNGATGWIARGNRHRRRGEGGAAESAYRQAAALDPALPFAWSRLGCLFAAQADWANAETAFAECRSRVDWVESGLVLDGAPLAALQAGPDPLAPVMGDLRPSARRLTVLVGCDAGYGRRYLPSLAASLADRAGLDATLHAHIVNPEADTAALVDRVGRDHPRLDLRLSHEILPLAGLSRNEANTYYACARFLRLPEILALDRHPVLVLDIDALVLADLGALVQSLATTDLALRRLEGPMVDPWNRYQASLVHVGAGPRPLAFARQLSRLLAYFHSRRLLHGFFDQTALFSILSVGPTLDVRFLPEAIYQYPLDRNVPPEAYRYGPGALIGEYKIP
jgi:Flp pilus assembly protein TadD